MPKTASKTGFNWTHRESVDSTNDLVLAAARRGEGTGLWVTADRQLKGRGRGGRSWASDPGNFHGSLLYVTHRPVGALSLLPLAAGLAVRGAIMEILVGEYGGSNDARLISDNLPLEGRSKFASEAQQTSGGGTHVEAAPPPEICLRSARQISTSPQGGGYKRMAPRDALGSGTVAGAGQIELPLALKWPNDVLLGGRKLAGILLESETLPGGGTAVAVGCGINLDHHPADAARPATDLAEHGAQCRITDLLPVLARRMAAALELFERAPGRVAESWLAAAHGLGGPIVVRLPSASFSGTFAGLDASGRLILEEEAGGRRLVSAGEVFFGETIPAEEGAA
jgi:BirA family biotin operon repressor/biotin-[acetyl-CoA-carboxylase] ligase